MNADVMAYTSRVLVNGVERPHLSWSVDRDLVGDLPEQVVSAGGVAQASGSIVWASDEDITDGGRNPWNPSTGWIPREGDRVQIFAGDGVNEWSQFVGLIDSSTGDIGGGFQSKIVDRIDDFSRRVNLPAMVEVMPPVLATGTFRRFRLSPRFHMSVALRRAGFYVTPPAEFGCVIDVPAVGSMWPLIGEGTRSERGSNANLSPSWPDGVHVSDVVAYYTPTLTRHWEIPLQLTMNIAPTHAGTVTMQARYGSSHVILRVTATQIIGLVNNVATASAPFTGGGVAQLLFKNGSVQVRTSTGANASGTAAWAATSNMIELRVIADANSRANGFQVSHPTAAQHEFASLGFTPSAVVATGAMHDAIAGARATREQTALDLLNEIGQALLFPFWIDETGVAQAVQSDVLRGRPSSQTVTTLDDIRELSWERNLLGARSEVITSYDLPVINRRRDYAQEVWSSTESVVLQSGDEHTSIIEPGSDEEWIMVDETLTVLGLHPLDDANKGIGSIAGGVYTDGVDEQWAASTEVNKLSVVLSKLNEGTWTLKHTAGTLAAGKQIELRTWSSKFTGNTGLWPYWWDHETPIIRAKGTMKTVQKERTPTILGSVGPVLNHDCKTWGTSHIPEDETRVVDLVSQFISEQVASPQPTITNLRVGYDPRRQLGDVINIKSDTLMGVQLKCLITSISNSSGDSFDQSLSVRIITAQSTYTTYAEFAKAWGDTADYESFAAAWDAISTYSDFNNDPLRGTT